MTWWRTRWRVCSICSAFTPSSSSAGRGSKEFPQSAVEGLRLLDVRDVRSLRDHHQLRPRYVLADVARARCGDVLLARDRQYRQLDVLQPGGGAELRDRLAAADIARDRRRGDQGADFPRRFAFPERLGEPALEGRLNERLHALRLRGLDALLPLFLGLRRLRMAGVGEHQALEDSRMAEREQLADHAAHRQADETRARDLEMLEQGVKVLDQCLEGVGARRRLACAMAARIVDQDVPAVLESGDLPVPHAHAARERVAQGEPGRAFLAVNFVVSLDAVGGRFHVFSRIRGIIISSSLVPPWLPM